MEPYYELDDEGNIQNIRWLAEQQTTQPEYLEKPFDEFEYDQPLFKCKSCGGIFFYENQKRWLEIFVNKKKRDIRIAQLENRICIDCSGKINKRIGYCKLKTILESPEHRKKTSERMTGENNPNWKGGIKFEPYCHLFNNEFKERVRSFWNRKCGICGKTEEENTQRLSVHHISYDKKACCNITKPLFIPLCQSCHTKTNNNRGFWEDYLTNYIMIWFNERCYHDK